ncbi:MAG: hypothetical protein ACO3XP_01975 [Ilumatobacteraceae bacterium]|jgi:hypothetical protein
MFLMHGAHFAKSYVNTYLENDIPTRIISYRNGWNLDSESLPAPEKYLTYEPIALDEWPTIITVAISMSSLERSGWYEGHPEYRVRYNMRTYVWVRDEGSAEATVMRDRLTTVVRSALLDRPCLKATDPRETFLALIDEGTLREEYSDLTLLKGDRVLAGSYLSYDLEINEIVAREDIGTAREFQITQEIRGIGERFSA